MMPGEQPLTVYLDPNTDVSDNVWDDKGAIAIFIRTLIMLTHSTL